MEIKFLRLNIFLLLFLLSSFFVCAQDAGYFVDYSGDQPRFVQRLAWSGDEYALFYEVQIQVFDEDGYYENPPETTADNFLEVSLSPGIYRYSVTPYDLLGRQGETSEWVEFEVIAAFQPVINKFTPSGFFMDQRLEKALYLDSENIFEGSEIYLRSPDNNIFPVEITIINDGRVCLAFDNSELIAGVYEIYVRNPGGLETSENGFSIGYRKPVYIFVKTAFTPVIPIYGELNEIFGGGIFLAGAALSFEAISSSQSGLNGGMEIAVSGNMINSASLLTLNSEGVSSSLADSGTETRFVNFDLNIALQKRYNFNQFAVTFRFGVGITLLEGYGDYDENGLFPHCNLGITGLFRIYNILYFEAGLNYSHLFTPNPSGLLRPWLGLTWQF